ncbi:predicted protein [Streptomyces iranensis]|uniref:Uncharacterized protein n=1 Tax=Streptomyces iranensis TaxID=576784 RepID=A0A060ZSU8_9ACTN|nr:predicted protein [Streptomyces iranensis]
MSPVLGFAAVCIMTRRTWLLVHLGCLDQIRAAEAEVMAVAWLVPRDVQTLFPQRMGISSPIATSPT